ncbi:hypothetical protein M8J76_010690 [Diaphorina citri]|nr:hypothetical protein M8J76_010690 [Diaphorina citri]
MCQNKVYLEYLSIGSEVKSVSQHIASRLQYIEIITGDKAELHERTIKIGQPKDSNSLSPQTRARKLKLGNPKFKTIYQLKLGPLKLDNLKDNTVQIGEPKIRKLKLGNPKQPKQSGRANDNLDSANPKSRVSRRP